MSKIRKQKWKDLYTQRSAQDFFIRGRLNFIGWMGADIFSSRKAKKNCPTPLFSAPGAEQIRGGRQPHTSKAWLVWASIPYAPYYEIFFITGRNILFRVSSGSFSGGVGHPCLNHQGHMPRMNLRWTRLWYWR